MDGGATLGGAILKARRRLDRISFAIESAAFFKLEKRTAFDDVKTETAPRCHSSYAPSWARYRRQHSWGRACHPSSL